MKRKSFIEHAGLLTAGLFLKNNFLFANEPKTFPEVRTVLNKRKFKSDAVEKAILDFSKKTNNKELAWLFNNCFPNTLDTTVDFTIVDGKPDTYVITGDIDAMWLRDSTAQVLPYLPLIKEDKNLQQLIAGVINRQIKSICIRV